MSEQPVRMQRPPRGKLSKGYNMQAASRAINGLPAVYVGRPTVWGNPFKPLDKNPSIADYAACKDDYLLWVLQRKTGNQIQDCYRHVMTLNLVWQRVGIIDGLPELRGHNLVCWCPLDQSCHGDILLQLANEEPCAGHSEASR